MGVFKRQLVWESCRLAKKGGRYKLRFLKLGTLGITKTRSNSKATWLAASHSLLLQQNRGCGWRGWAWRVGSGEMVNQIEFLTHSKRKSKTYQL